jgi:hypothetical protein
MTNNPDPTPQILALADAGTPVAAISHTLELSPSTVYATLRTHRPDRTRSPRTRTSPKRAMVLGLLAAGIPAPRVALLAGVTRQWVHALKKEVGK